MSPRGHNYDAIVVADPGAACRSAIGAGLVVHRADPLNEIPGRSGLRPSRRLLRKAQTLV